MSEDLVLTRSATKKLLEESLEFLTTILVHGSLESLERETLKLSKKHLSAVIASWSYSEKQSKDETEERVFDLWLTDLDELLRCDTLATVEDFIVSHNLCKLFKESYTPLEAARSIWLSNSWSLPPEWEEL
jgi:hypothetical protein